MHLDRLCIRIAVLASFLALLGVALPESIRAQVDSIPEDLDPLVRSGDRFDVYFTRGFLLGGEFQDTVKFNSAFSGSTCLGVGFNLFITRALSLRVSPGINFYSVQFSQPAEKKFPTDDNSEFTYERVRTLYFELPLSVGQVISRKNDKIQVYLEGGAIVGYKITDNVRQFRAADNARIRIPQFPGINPWRGDVFAKLVYRFLALEVRYRFTRFFTDAPFDTYYNGTPAAPGSIRPRIPGFEFAIGIVL
jgi:hypothetical protein